jgi:AAA+ superfamily predicted ATPase
MDNKRVQQDNETNCNNYTTPYKIVYFNKLLKSIDKEQHKIISSYNLKKSKIPLPITLHIKNNNSNIINEAKTNIDTYKIAADSKDSHVVDVTINVEINTISDLINLIETYKLDKNINYNIDIASLHNIKEPLIELNNMIGMKQLKSAIVDQILYFMQGMNKNSNDFMHTVIYGLPGTGKTEIAKIIGKIFSKLGVLSKGTFKKVTRSDLIAGYVGQTSIKTKEVIKNSVGGVLFIDEAYALGNSEKKDSFSKECIDTLCEALSDYKEDLMVIIAGYENELNECFFNYNSGLDSRFVWRFKTDEYSGEDLYNIFLKKVNEHNWEVLQDITSNWFIKNKEYFNFFGRDIENLLAKTKIVHSKRVFCKNVSEKKKINLDDLENGFTIYLNNNNAKNKKDSQYIQKQIQYSMYY